MKNTNCKIGPIEASFTPWSPLEGSTPVAVMMSGGVDSSVTAHLLKQDGWDVVGVTMRIPVSCELSTRGCCGADAAFVCHELGVPHYFVDVGEAFNELIIDRFRNSYAAGETPNPCADCNTLLKFSLLWDFIKEELGIDYAATGHYAKLTKTQGGVRLGRGLDKSKDQSYFLYGMPADRLDKLILPLGDKSKTEIRDIAAQLGLSVADKPESMELCFAGEDDYRKALADAQANREGPLTDMEGKQIGKHKGISNYTLGQRRGLGFAGGQPLYVGKIDAVTNTVAIGTREQVSCKSVSAGELNILIPEELTTGARLAGKIRSYGDTRALTITSVTDDELTVEFTEPVFAPSGGQKLVIYDANDYIVAGGTILSRGTKN